MVDMRAGDFMTAEEFRDDMKKRLVKQNHVEMSQ